jgi:hypothetical protein
MNDNAIVQGLGLLGYEPGTPPGVSEESRLADEGFCQESECEVCGRRGLLYRPFRRGRAYVALAACPECSHTVEF